jgi:hypothetical protein
MIIDNKRFNKIQFVEVFLCGFSFALTSFNKMNSHKEEPKQGQVFFPDHLLRKIDTARSNLLPQKSSGRYLKEYKGFCNWRLGNKVVGIDERVMLAFFGRPISEFETLMLVVLLFDDKELLINTRTSGY